MVNTAGEARLAIVPDVSGFRRKLQEDMKSVKAEFSLGVTANTAQARADIARLRDSEQRKNITLTADVALRDAEAQIAAFRAQQRANDVNVKVKADTSDAITKVKKLTSEINSAFGALTSIGKVNLQVIGIGAIPAATAALVELAGALQQVAQAGLAIPGIMSGAVASIGTFAIGVSGISDAYSAVTKAADSAGQSQVRSANTAERAQRELNNAYRDAKQEIEDLNLAARGDQISQQQAVLNAQKARRQLQRDLASGQIKDQLDLQSDLLDIQAADQQVAETTQRNIENQQKLNQVNAQGIEGNDRVVAAHEAVANAAAASGKATDAAALAMSKLAPNAQEFLKTVIDIKNGGGKDLKQTVQNNMFAGLSTSLRTLADADLPHLKSGLGSIATAWNGLFKQLGTSLGSKSSQGLLDRILGNTADAQTRMQKAVDPLVHAFGTLSAAGSDSLPRLADGITAVANRFDAFISAADKDGRLDKWINDGLTGMRQLGDILLNLGRSFTDITKAAGGQGFLGVLDNASKKLADFLGSDKGQEQMRGFFQQARQDLANWLPVLQNLPGIFVNVMNAARDWMNGWLPLLQEGTQLLRDNPDLVKGVVNAFAAWQTIKGVTDLATSLKSIADLLKISLPAAAAEGASGITRALGPLAAVFAVGTFGPEMQKWAEDNLPGAKALDSLPTPADAGKAARDWVDQHILGEGKPAAGNPNVAAPQGSINPGIPPSQANAPAGTRESGGVPTPTGTPSSQANAPAGTRESGGIPHFARGGATPNGRGNGPTGGWISELHSDEWVLPAHARRAIGDKNLAAITAGRSFEPGGYVDTWGNPITPGPAPGPAAGQPQIAPNPMSGAGGVGGIFSQVLSGLNGPISNIAGIAQAGIGAAQSGGMPGAPSLADRAAQLPGLAGLIGSAASSNPQAALMNWGSNTAQYVANWGMSTLGKVGSALWQGALGFFGLQNSILSPSNPYFQSAQQTGQFFLGQDGPIGTLLGMGGNGSNLPYSGDTNSVGAQTLTLPDGTQVQVPTYGTSVSATGSANGAVMGPNGPLSQAAVNAISFAQTHAVGQKYQYGGVGTTGGYDCSGIASAVYAAAKGLPQGQRYFTTESDFSSLGFQPGYQQGALNIGVHRGGGGPNSHMALTLPNGVNVESGGASNTTQYGGSAAGAMDGQFDLHFFLPLPSSMQNSSGVGIPLGPAGTYASGGGVPGSGRGDTVPAMLTPGEHVLTTADVAAMGGQKGVYAFRQALHFALGGGVPESLPVIPSPTPNIQAQLMVPRPAPQPRPQQPQTPAPTPAPAPSTQPAPAPQQTPTAQPTYSPAQTAIAANPTTGTSGMINHNLPALSTAIKSGASLAGQLAAMGISMGAAGGTGGLGGMGAGALGQFVSGAIQEGGKVADQAANVVSSLLVGNVPGTMGQPGARAYGQTVIAPQRVPVTAPLTGGDTYTFNGMDPARMMQEFDIRKAQQAQGINAKYGG